MSVVRNSTGQPSERDAEQTHAKATKAEFAKEYDQAFQLYIKAAEAFLHLSRSGTATDKKKLQWKNSAAKSLERAEIIKKFVDASRNAVVIGAPRQATVPNIRLTPIVIDVFSQQEQSYVVMKGAYVNGHRFPLWDESSGPTSVIRDSEVYSDPEGQPQLSEEQQKEAPVWQRTLSSHPSSETPRSPRRNILPQEILQHIVTDCSVCASISVCLEHGQRFGSSLVESAVHGLFVSPGHMSAKGRYDVRVYFNGGWRRIGEVNAFAPQTTAEEHFKVIDDQLPFHPISRTLMCMTVLSSSSSSTDSQITRDTIWPSLLEKAYMKLMGGYDFLGSNSSIDLHALIGWIPEHVDIRRSQFERERTWERMKHGFLNGQCLITLGTGVNSDIRWRSVCLLSSHSYAVIDVHESSDDRILTVLDSWVRSEGDKRLSSVLRIPWSEVLNTFDGLYFSWDPSIYSTQLTFHGIWKLIGGDDESRTTHLQAEFQCNPSGEDEVLILLTRHVADTKKTSDYVALHVQIEDHFILNSESSSIHRLLSSRGAYINSTQVLNRVRIPHSQRSGIFSISVSYEGDGIDVGYTMTMYSQKNVKLAWIENQKPPSYKEKVTGSFTSKTAGGNCTYPSFMINPQYRLCLHPSNLESEKARVTLTLQVGKDLPVNVAMVWSQGQRISEFSEKELVATSGAYSYGLARVTKAISWDYTIAVSAFEPQRMGPFTLKVESSHPFDMHPIPQEGAGMYSRVIQGSWDGRSAAGAPSFGRYTKNPVFNLEVPSSTQLKIRLQLLHSSPAVALNVTVFAKVGDDAELSLTRKPPVLTSGAYDDTMAGVATAQITFGAGSYFVVPSTYSPGHEAEYKLIVYSSASGVTITPV